MATVRADSRELDVKVVYYGPALSGKTTNLVALQRLLGPDRTGAMLSLDTEQDRTLFFDLLPVDLGVSRGLKVRIRLFTVPGQVHYAATRRVVLGGADGVVLVLHSDPAKAPENAAAVRDLRASLLANRLDPAEVPITVQWNKRDLPGCLTLPELAKGLLPWRPTFTGAVATQGIGVRETFVNILQASLMGLASRLRMPELEATALELRKRIDRSCSAPVLAERPERASQRLRLPSCDTRGSGTGPLVHQALQGVVAAAEEAGDRERERRLAARERDQMRELALLSERLLSQEASAVLGDVVRWAMSQAGADAGLLLLPGATGQLEPRVLEGIARVPLLPGAIEQLLSRGGALLIEDLAAELTGHPVTDGERVFHGAINLSLGPPGEAAGILLLLASGEHAPLEPSSLPVLQLLASQVGLFLRQSELCAQVSTSRRAWLQTADALEDMLYVVDEGFVLRRVNRAFSRAVGHGPTALVGRRCHEVLQGRDQPCAACFLRPILEGRQVGPKALELQGYMAGRSLEARVVPLEADNGRGTLALATLRDVTARKAMARELMESEKLAALGRLAAGMSHEVNNPLAFIQGNLQYLLELLDGPLSAQTRKDATAAVSDAAEGVERLRRVVAQLARCAPQEGAPRVPLDLLLLARQSTQLALDECSRPGVLARVTGQPLLIVGHPGELGVVIRVLVRNAIEASPHRGTVAIAVGLSDGMPRVTIHDDGPGIAPQARPHLFEPFFTTKAPGKHMGLSLAMAHAVMKAMGGSLDVDEGARPGTTFFLELPSASLAPAPAARRQAAELAPRHL